MSNSSIPAGITPRSGIIIQLSPGDTARDDGNGSGGRVSDKYTEYDSTIIRHMIVVTLFVALFLVLYPFFTLAVYSAAKGFKLTPRRMAAAGVTLYTAVLAVCTCILIFVDGATINPTERDFVIALAVSANVYMMLSMARLCKVVTRSGQQSSGNDEEDKPPSYEDAANSPLYTRPLFIQDESETT